MSAKVIASLVANIGANTTGFEQGSKKVTGGLSSMASKFSSVIPAGVMQFASLGGAITAVGLAASDAIKDQIAYANSVRELATIGDTSTESASRFIQVLDDYKITAADATTASKALKEQGLVPTVETLAQLSDAYLAIQDPAEKMKFIQDNLGRGGTRWVEILNKGSAALLSQNEAVAKNLILTKKMVDDARRAEIATDQWNDSVTGLKTTFATGMLPVLTRFVEGINEGNRAAEIMVENGLNPANKASIEYRNALKQAHEEQISMTQSMIDNADAIDSNTRSTEENAAALKEISDLHSGMISLIGSIQSADEAYTEKSKDLTKQRQDTETELAKFRAQGYWEQSDQIQGALSKLDEIAQAEADLAKERERQSLEFISGILAENLARDGWTQAEFEAFAKQQEAWGLWSADVVAKAQAAWQEADKITASINAIPDSKSISIMIGSTIDSATRSYMAMAQSYGGSSNGGGGGANRHASGGDFLIPQSYGNEGFRLGNGDTASGGEHISITPAGRGGKGGGNITVNIMLDSATPDPERVAYNLGPAVKRVLRAEGII